MKPGDTQLTRTLRAASSRATWRRVAQDPALRRRVGGAAHAHGGRDRRHVHDRAASRLADHRDGGLRAHVHAPQVDAEERSHVSSVVSQVSRSSPCTMPALLTSTSRRPNSPVAVVTACSAPTSSVETSPTTRRASVPRRGPRRRRRRRRGSSRSTMTTRAPSLAKRFAVARPNPDAPPVTIADLAVEPASHAGLLVRGRSRRGRDPSSCASSRAAARACSWSPGPCRCCSSCAPSGGARPCARARRRPARCTRRARPGGTPSRRSRPRAARRSLCTM